MASTRHPFREIVTALFAVKDELTHSIVIVCGGVGFVRVGSVAGFAIVENEKRSELTSIY